MKGDPIAMTKKREFPGSRTRALRKSRGLTQKELSEKLGIEESKLSRFENGKGYFTTELLVQTTNILGATPNDVLRDSIDPQLLIPPAVASRADIFMGRDAAVQEIMIRAALLVAEFCESTVEKSKELNTTSL